MKNKTSHRHLHPIHWHGSMVVAIAAILLTSVKTSGEMLRALQALPVHGDVVNAVSLRDAETHNPHIILAMTRRTAYSGA